eukprot:63660_1
MFYTKFHRLLQKKFFQQFTMEPSAVLSVILLIITNILSIYWLCKLCLHVKQKQTRNDKTIAAFNNIHGCNNNECNVNSTNTEETNNPIFAMMKLIKKHSNYKIMQQNKPLTTRELIGLILYTYSRGYCNKMKQSRNDWYVDTSNAIEKIYSVLHYKNDQQQPKILFHGSANPSLDQFSQEELLLKTFCSFTTEFSIAKKFATGSILVITQVDERLRSGQLKGANVSWISPYDEYEWIILPTIFHSWREMSKQEIIDNGWTIGNDIKVYITNDYESNIYNELSRFNACWSHSITNMNEAIKHWFLNEFRLKTIDSMNYFNLFIENGYNTFELIKEISCADDLNAMGIIKIAHVNYMLKKIKILDKFLNQLTVAQNQVTSEQMDQIMKDMNQHKDDYVYYRRRINRIICECEWIHHDTIPTNQFAPITTEDRQHISEFHPDLHRRLNNL